MNEIYDRDSRLRLGNHPLAAGARKAAGRLNGHGQGHSIIALGSNQGERARYLSRAMDALSESNELLSHSPVYETEPIGDTDQPSFLNMVLKISTRRSPLDLLTTCQAIERELGRIRDASRPFGPRTIDIDLLFFDDIALCYPSRRGKPALEIPHPRAHSRAFVLAPLNDIAPRWMHPTLCRPMETLYRDLDPRLKAGAQRLTCQHPKALIKR